MPASPKKVSKKGGKVERKKNKDGKLRKAPSHSSYATYVHRLLKQKVAKNNKKGLRITARAMGVVNSFVVDMLDRLAGEAGRACAFAGLQTLQMGAVMAAVKMELPGDLATHALAHGVAAVAAYEKASGKKSKK